MTLKKIRINVKGTNLHEHSTMGSYFGPVPPRDVYRCRVSRMTNTVNSKGDMMLKVINLIEEPSGTSRARYNGYAIFDNLNVTQVGAPFVNAMLNALSGGRKEVLVEFWKNGFVEDETHVVKKISDIPLDGSNIVYVAGKPDVYKGVKSLKVGSYVLPDAAAEAQSSMDMSRSADPEGEESEDEDSGLEEDEDSDPDPDPEEDPEAGVEDLDEEAGPEAGVRGAELEAMDRAELVSLARGLGVTKTNHLSEVDLRERILELEEVPF